MFLLLLLFFPFAANAQTIWSGAADTTWYTDHKEETEFTITTAEQLAGLSRLTGTYSMKGITIKLGNDIMLNDTTGWQNWADNPPRNGWTAIGIGENDAAPFSGTFDGDGHAISGVYININYTYQGFFSYVKDGAIKNLGLTAFYIKGIYVGSLVGKNIGSPISNSYAIGKIESSASTGGLICVNEDSPISHSHSHITGNISASSYVGGLVGRNTNSPISKSYATGNVEGKDNYVGGLVGDASGAISESYAIGNVTGNDGVGGLVGNSNNIISNSYAAGAVKGKSKLGGLIGMLANSSSSVTFSYYDMEKSGRVDIGKGEPRATDQMKLKSTYTKWDFTEIWGIDKEINSGYPHLKFSVSSSSAGETSSSSTESSSSSHNSNSETSSSSTQSSESSSSSKTPSSSSEKISSSSYSSTSSTQSSESSSSSNITSSSSTSTKTSSSSGEATPILPTKKPPQIQLSNLPPNTKIEVYNLQGKLIYSSHSENSQILKILVQTKGIYFVKINNQTLRVPVI
ncbi:hypothetical protein R83H12_01251 [Fibrobacteria bacterium R8-3-H12]